MKNRLLLNCLLALLVLSAAALSIDKEHKGADVSEFEVAAQSLLDEADSVFQSHDYQGALAKYQESLQQARREFNRPVEVEALAQLARVYLIQGNKEEGRKWLAQAQEKASDNDPMGWSRYLGVRGRFEWKDDSLPAARQTFDEMYTYCNVNAIWGRAVDAAHMIAIVAETPEEQIEWSRRGIEAAEAGDQEKWLGPLWNNLAITYYDQKLYDTALDCFLKAREYHWRYSDETAKLFADYHVGMIYRYLGKYDEAGKWLRPVLAWAERLKNRGAIGQACEDLGEIAIAQGNKGEGLSLLRRARDEYKAEGYDQSWPELWQSINKRLKELGG